MCVLGAFFDGTTEVVNGIITTGGVVVTGVLGPGALNPNT